MDPLVDSGAQGDAPWQKIYLYLYIAGESPNSVRAMANLKAICERHLEEGRYQIVIVDILKDPLRALDDGILVTPTLIRLGAPSRRVIGDLSDHDKVVDSLHLGQEGE